MSVVTSTITNALHAGDITAFCSSLLFLVGYTVMAPWWRYTVGRAFASLDAAVMLTLLPSVIHLWFGVSITSAFFAWYEVTSFFVVAATTLWRLATIRQVQSSATPDSVPKESK
jgi:hypothetical protein